MLEHEIHELDWSGECDDGWAARCYCGWRVVRASEFDAEAQVDAHIALAECTSRDCQFVHDHSRPATPEDVRRAVEAPAMPDDAAMAAAGAHAAEGYPAHGAAAATAVGWQRGWAAGYAAGREARDAGPRMDSSPRFFGCTPLLCELRAGHIGGHQSGTTSWTKADDVERARSERDAYEAGFEAGREAAAQAIEARMVTAAKANAALPYMEGLNDAAEIARGGSDG